MSDSMKEVPSTSEASPSSTSSTPVERARTIHSFLEPARQIPLAWISALLTLLLFILTVVYASQTSFVSGIHFIYASSSRPIFVLRVLSELTNVLLACTIAAAFERVQWLLVAGKDGLRFTDFVCLQAGTGAPGLLTCSVGKGIRTVMTRLWSTIRLASIILIPVLGVLIMSNVQTKLAFYTVQRLDPPLGFGMRSFNASIAQQLAPATDILFSMAYGQFLTDPTLAVDLTPTASRPKSCSQGIDTHGGQTCERVVFVPGGINLIAPQLLSHADVPEADVYLTQNQQGYVLRFGEDSSNWRSENKSTCRVYGSQYGFRLCLRNSANTTLHANIVQCPIEISREQQCSVNTSWQSSPGWSTTLKTSFRNASVAFSRLNGTILSHTFNTEKETPAPVNSSELFRAYDSFFGDSNDPSQEIFNLVAGGSNRPFVFFIWFMLDMYEKIGKTNAAAVTRNVNGLQELLTIPLYFCQSASTAIDSSLSYLTNGTLPTIIAPMTSTSVSLATLRYTLVVGRGTVIAYIVLTAAALGLCFTALLVGSVGEAAKRIPDTTLFPIRDFCVNCDIMDGHGKGLERCEFDVLGKLKGKELFRKMDGLKVTRRRISDQT